MVRRTAYDKANRPLSKTLEDFVHYDGTHRDVILESQQYDAAGHVVVQVKGGGKQRTASVYDAAGRVTCATLDPAGVDRVLDMMYDPNGNVLSRSLTAAGRTETTRSGRSGALRSGWSRQRLLHQRHLTRAGQEGDLMRRDLQKAGSADLSIAQAGVPVRESL